MKKAFTLLELMITIAVLAILMGLVVKLGNVGTDTYRRTLTISRMQKVENCLSGYHAAFGCYPPVKVHGSRDIFLRAVNSVQSDEVQTGNDLVWDNVYAACVSQPVAARFPFPEGFKGMIQAISEEMQDRAQRANNGDDRFAKYKGRNYAFDGAADDPGRFNSVANDTDWRDIQLFKFGLMSFLLPRYVIMMNGRREFYENFAQWKGNNETPCNPFTGKHFNNWKDVQDRVRNNDLGQYGRASVLNIPSQAACARWMPNLEGTCAANYNVYLFGVNVKGNDSSCAGELNVENSGIEIFAPPGTRPGQGSSSGGGGRYILDGITVRDGWWHELYYYSPAPYQRYTLWSAGPNGRTFPPWISIDKLTTQQRATATGWMKDDIRHLSN